MSVNFQSELEGIALLFDSIAGITNELEGELAERSEYLSTAIRCMAQQGSARSEALSAQMVKDGYMSYGLVPKS